MKSLVTFLVLFVFSNVVNAQPIYLECEGEVEVTKNACFDTIYCSLKKSLLGDLKLGDRALVRFNVRIDVDNNNISYERGSDLPYTVRSVFKPEEIIINASHTLGGSIRIINQDQVTINRVDLSYYFITNTKVTSGYDTIIEG